MSANKRFHLPIRTNTHFWLIPDQPGWVIDSPGTSVIEMQRDCQWLVLTVAVLHCFTAASGHVCINTQNRLHQTSVWPKAFGFLLVHVCRNAGVPSTHQIWLRQRCCFYGHEKSLSLHVCVLHCVWTCRCKASSRPSLFLSLVKADLDRHYAVAVSSHCANVTRVLSWCHLWLLPAVHFDTSGIHPALSLTRNPDEHGTHTREIAHVHTDTLT